MAISVMQGDRYSVLFVLRAQDGTLITDQMVKTVVLNLGNMSRQYPGDVTYEDGKWLFPMSQKQSFAMKGAVEPQARIEFTDGTIFGGAGRKIPVVSALNRGIIGGETKDTATQAKPVSIEIGGGTGNIGVTIGAASAGTGGGGTIEGAVRYDVTQNLTPEQQERARKNIGVSDYTLPVATPDTLGGVMPDAKTDDMTTPVGVDADGRLWVKAEGGSTLDTIPADKVMFESNLIFTEQFGRYKPVDGKVEIPAEDQSLLAVLNDAFSQDKNPTITQPTVSVSSSTARAYEVGTSVTPAYSGSFAKGSYEYGPDDTSVAANAWSAKNNVTSEEKTTQSGTFAAYVVPDGANYKITLSGTYSDGAIPLTALGKPYPAGQIKGATKTATSGAITGYRNSFYGTMTTKPDTVTSSTVRALAQKSGRALANGSTFTVNVPVGAMCVLISYPATLRELSSVKDVNGLNADITSAFVQSTADVEGTNGYTAISYRVYRLDFASANDVANTYSVKI